MAVGEVGVRGWQTACDPLIGILGESVEPDLGLAPGAVEEQVRGDPVQPALESAGGVGAQRPEHSYEDLLSEILGVVGLPVRRYASR